MTKTYSLTRHAFWVVSLSAMVASMLLVGCGSNNSGGSAPPPVVVVPLSPTPIATVGRGVYLAMNLQILSRPTFELFLQNAQLCSPRIVGWSIGAANCESYSSAGWLGFQVSGGGIGIVPTAVNVTVGAGAGSPWDYNHSGWTTEVKKPSFPLSNLGLANGSSGFTGTGYYGLRMVTTGFPGTTTSIAVDLIYNGIVFARGNAHPN
jgi:hypothetical protein